MTTDTKQMLMDALNNLIVINNKISVKAVADKAGLSHSVIYNRYPDLLIIIKKAQQDQASKKASEEAQYTIDQLKARLKTTQKKVISQKCTNDINIPTLLAVLQQVYSMYDQILEERNELAKELTSLQSKAPE